MLISPLAKKLCIAKGILPTALRGSGPRGRIMAADVLGYTAAPARRGKTAISDFHTQPTRPTKDGYYVYDGEVNMQALAAISLPIAVQCEKLLENRYSLFDYIVRAVVKATQIYSGWKTSAEKVDILLFENSGEKLSAITDAADKTIYRIARETHQTSTIPENYHPHIVVCDARTTRTQVAEHLKAENLLCFAFVTRGNTAKVGIRAGAEEMSKYTLSYTFYAVSTITQKEANRIAACLQAMLYNPVRLLLLS